MRFGLVFSLLLAIVAVIFALQNPQPMDVNLLFVRTEGSTALVLILTFGFGVIVGLLSSLPGRMRARRELKELRAKNAGEGSSASITGSKSSRGSSSPGTPDNAS